MGQFLLFMGLYFDVCIDVYVGGMSVIIGCYNGEFDFEVFQVDMCLLSLCLIVFDFVGKLVWFEQVQFVCCMLCNVVDYVCYFGCLVVFNVVDNWFVFMLVNGMEVLCFVNEVSFNVLYGQCEVFEWQWVVLVGMCFVDCVKELMVCDFVWFKLMMVFVGVLYLIECMLCWWFDKDGIMFQLLFDDVCCDEVVWLFDDYVLSVVVIVEWFGYSELCSFCYVYWCWIGKMLCLVLDIDV